LPAAVLIIASFALLSIAFVRADFSFGYFIGFYFYTMVAGYLWLNCFSEFHYDHRLTGLSAAVSAVAFLLPALFISSPARQIYVLSARNFNILLDAILLLGVTVVAAGSLYSFKPVGLMRMISLHSDVYVIREALVFPTSLNYLIGITSNALLPFAFACLLELKRPWRAGLTLALLLLLYPITLTKMALFSSVWIVALSLAATFLDSRKTIVLSLLVPTVIGIVLAVLFKSRTLSESLIVPYFTVVNFRFVAIPSLALDYYNEFFSRHELTHFCQVNVLKLFMTCPYSEPISTVIYKEFGIGGNFNASLFATEGIASVGPSMAPASALAGGLVAAFANRLSAGLPSRLILTSSAVLIQMMLNVPLTISLLSYGAASLFALWYITPRAIFEPKTGVPGRFDGRLLAGT
jgi:hypothetical protein